MKKIVPLLIGLLFLSGCAVSLSRENSTSPSPRRSSAGAEAGAYQYATPWDQEMFDGFYKQAKEVPAIGAVKGGIVPHHLLAGYIPATFFNYLSAQKPSLIVLIGPNHFDAGKQSVISSLRDWQTPYGTLQTDKSLVENLLKEELVSVDEEAMKGEHGINSLVSFIKKSLPETRIVSLILKYKTSTSTLDLLIENLEKNLPADAVVVASVDFSHYMTWPVANFHDELTEQAIKNFDYSRIYNLEIDSPPSVYALLKLMEYYGAQKVGYELHDNSARLMSNPSLAETTSHYSPYFITGPKTTKKISSLLFFGDMMLERNVKNAFDKNGGPDYLFTKLAGGENRFFMGQDAIHANLEGPFADSRRQTSKSIAFRFDPGLIPTLKKYNFSIFSAANNHSSDMGAAGFSESKNNLTKAGLLVYGRQDRVDDKSLLVKQVGDFKIGFIGINDANSPVSLSKVTDLINKARCQTVIPAKAGIQTNDLDSRFHGNDNCVDFVIVNIHWGEEYKEVSNTHQQTLAHALIDAGADVIIGHHPHVVQEMEIYSPPQSSGEARKNRPIFYSLGNFIFDQYFSTPTQQGLAVGLILKDKQISISVFPLQGVKSQTQLMGFDQAYEYLKNWQKKSRISEQTFNNFNLNLKK